MVREALSAGLTVLEIICVPGMECQLPDNTADLTLVDEGVFSYLSDTKTPQGVMAVVRMPENNACAPVGNCAVLDGVADPGNLGTIIRTCAAVGIKDLYLCNCTDAFSPKAIRSSMSGIFFVNIHSFDRETVYSLIKDTAITVADMDGENLFERKVNEPYSIVIGNEANGVSDFFRERASVVLSIPMDSRVESLNAAVSFAVMAYTLNSGRN